MRGRSNKWLLLECLAAVVVLAVESSSLTQRVESSPALTVAIKSKCPTVRDLATSVLFPDLRSRNSTALRVEFICEGDGDTLTAHHGEDELQGNKVLACVQHVEQSKLVPFWECLIRDLNRVHDAGAECAKSSSVEWSKVEECVKSKSVSLLKESREYNRKHGVSKSPTVLVNDKILCAEEQCLSMKDQILKGISAKPHEPKKKKSGKALLAQ